MLRLLCGTLSVVLGTLVAEVFVRCVCRHSPLYFDGAGILAKIRDFCLYRRDNTFYGFPLFLVFHKKLLEVVESSLKFLF